MNVIVSVILTLLLSFSYVDRAQRFSIEPPEGWIVQVADEEIGVAIFASPENDAALVIVPIEAGDSISLDSLPSKYEEMVKAGNASIVLKMLSETKIIVAGKQALQRQYSADIEGAESGKMVVTFVKEGKLALILSGTTDEPKFAKFEPIFKKSVDTLRFPSGQNSGATAEIQAKLKALNDAHSAGILSDEEYALKKAELEAQLRAFMPAIDEETQRKLKALDDAHQAGILSDGEYERKKAELMGQVAPAMPQQLMKGKVYQHQKGFYFLYPEGWNVIDQEGYLQLIPSGVNIENEAPDELYTLMAEDAASAGIQRPDDQEVIGYIDEELRSLIPSLQRKGDVSPIKLEKGNAVLVEWEASSPQGDIVSARAFISIVDKYVLALTAMGLKQRLDARDEDLRGILASFGTGEPPKPPALVSQDQGKNQGNIGTAQILPDEVGDPNWGFKFKPPAGWKSQKTNEGIIMSHDTIAGIVLIVPHMEDSLQKVQQGMLTGLTEEGVQLSLTGSLQPFGNSAFVGEYSGIFNGQQVKAHGVGTFSPYGGGAYIVAITTPDKFGAEISAAADAVGKAIVYFKVDVSDLMRHFIGTWASYTSHTEDTFVLTPDGQYLSRYTASYSGELTDGWSTGDGSTDWGLARDEHTKGRWIVRGNKEQGAIIVTFQDGSQTTLEYKVHVEKGETYWSEYWINGRLYAKQRE